MSELETVAVRTVDVDGAEIPAWAERTACLLTYCSIRVITVTRDDATGGAVLSVGPRAVRKGCIYNPMAFASYVATTLRSIGLTLQAFSDEMMSTQLPPGSVHVRAEYDACANESAVLVFGLEDDRLPSLPLIGARWLECDVDAPPAVVVGEA